MLLLTRLSEAHLLHAAPAKASDYVTTTNGPAMPAGNLNGGFAGKDDDSSDWEEASEEGSESDALEVHGLPPGQDLLDIAAAAASAHDYANGITKVCVLAFVPLMPKRVYRACPLRSPRLY